MAGIRKNRFAIVLLAAVLVITTVFTGIKRVSAEETDASDTTYNIEVVVDASGSMLQTDEENNRYTAIDIFLQTLRENGNNVGAIVFTTEIQIDTGLSEMSDKMLKKI